MTTVLMIKAIVKVNCSTTRTFLILPPREIPDCPMSLRALAGLKEERNKAG